MIEEAEAHKNEPTGVVQLDDFMQILRSQQWETCDAGMRLLGLRRVSNAYDVWIEVTL